MRWLSIALGGWGLVILFCIPAMARTSHDIHGGNCVAYARDVTGVQLDGNAAAWWPHAEGRYERGHTPQVGAILVFKPYGGMHVGHVAVVSRVVGDREVLVDQANWVRGRVTKAMSVIDASPGNDWTSVKVQYAGTHGRENPTYGFIYPHAVPVSLGVAVAATEPDQPRADHVAARTGHHRAADDDEDAAAQDDPAPPHVTERVKHRKDAAEREAAAKTAPASRHVATRTKHHAGTDEQEATAQPGPAPRHLAERAKHPKNADEQEVAAQPNPVPQQAAVHVSHRKAAPPHDETRADPSARPAQQLAAATPAHHKHKDPRLAYVLY